MRGWVIMGGYMGDIYLDVPYDNDLPLYQELEAYLQHSDDRMRFDNLLFFYLSLEQARENASRMSLASLTTCEKNKNEKSRTNPRNPSCPSGIVRETS